MAAAMCTCLCDGRVLSRPLTYAACCALAVVSSAHVRIGTDMLTWLRWTQTRQLYAAIILPRSLTSTRIARTRCDARADTGATMAMRHGRLRTCNGFGRCTTAVGCASVCMGLRAGCKRKPWRQRSQSNTARTAQAVLRSSTVNMINPTRACQFLLPRYLLRRQGVVAYNGLVERNSPLDAELRLYHALHPAMGGIRHQISVRLCSRPPPTPAHVTMLAN